MPVLNFTEGFSFKEKENKTLKAKFKDKTLTFTYGPINHDLRCGGGILSHL